VARILLDTNVLLWVLKKPARLPPAAAALIQDTENELLFSAASIWEIAIKAALQRPDFDVDVAELVPGALAMGLVERPVTAALAARVADLPLLHRDPFDRLLVAQALAEPARLLTADRLLAHYSELVEAFDPL
jgi:PIN domain nuclease of toxin-antitoxin system